MNVYTQPSWLVVLGYLLWCSPVIHSGGISDLFELQTNQLLAEDVNGIVSAFGDFNSDERGDIFLISNNSQGVSVLLAQDSKPYVDQTLIMLNASQSSVITSIVPADYNGDDQIDVMVITRGIVNKAGPYQASIYWGNMTTKQLDPSPFVISEQFEDEPLVFDYNADMLPDLLAEPAGKPGVRKVWLANTTKTFRVIDFPKTKDTPFYQPQSHAFIDLNNDLAADLVLTTLDGYEIWMNVPSSPSEDRVFQYNSTRPFPDGFKTGRTGQSSFADLDLDQTVDHIVPGCLDAGCTQSAIYVFNIQTHSWDLCLGYSGFNTSEQIWNFVPEELSQYESVLNQSFLITLRMGDYELDGYNDALAVLSGLNSKGEKIQRVFLFSNIPCHHESCAFPRTFRLEHDKEYAEINKGVVVGTFYDVYEDGLPDIVMNSMVQENGVTLPKIVIMKNSVAADHCFIKVTVVSGLCGDKCQDKSNANGVNYPGAAVTFSTTRTEGGRQISYGTQLPQTAHFALQTPYQTFGLGSTPNFINSLVVGIPSPKGESPREKSFPFIIPNSQLVVIPHPPNESSSWKMKLYVTPSHAIYVTGAALLGTCVFVACITGILHWREKKEDFLEKKQEAQRFHFDAM